MLKAKDPVTKPPCPYCSSEKVTCYEKRSPGLWEAKRDIKKISSDLLTRLGEQLTRKDILFITVHGYVKAVT